MAIAVEGLHRYDDFLAAVVKEAGGWTLGDPFEIECDAVVLVTQRVSDERLFLELTTPKVVASARSTPSAWRRATGCGARTCRRSTTPSRPASVSR